MSMLAVQPDNSDAQVSSPCGRAGVIREKASANGIQVATESVGHAV